MKQSGARPVWFLETAPGKQVEVQGEWIDATRQSAFVSGLEQRVAGVDMMEWSIPGWTIALDPARDGVVLTRIE